MEVRFRPLTTWPGERVKRRQRDRFDTGFTVTLDLLKRELRHLSARNVVIELALTEADIRTTDGWPRASARPSDPGIVISFDSRYGPLRYATDAFFDWQANIRAVALGLEALRKVDRYGITKRGEQYSGWKALPPGIPLMSANGFASTDEAWQFILQQGDPNGTLAAEFEDDGWTPLNKESVYRAAAKKLHPDSGGDHDLFVRLQQAWKKVSA